MTHRLPPATLAAACLLLIAVSARAESYEGPLRREAPRERPAREAPRGGAERGAGYRGLTLLRAHA